MPDYICRSIKLQYYFKNQAVAAKVTAWLDHFEEFADVSLQKTTVYRLDYQ
jgi:hypothetical protein